MAGETEFALSVAKSIRLAHPESFVWRPRDGYTLGLPDIMALIQGRPTLALELKQLQHYLKTWDDPGKRDVNAPFLQHPFSGPQISTLRAMAKAGAEVYGVVRVTPSHAFMLRPESIPPLGNPTYTELRDYGRLIFRMVGTGWNLWAQ